MEISRLQLLPLDLSSFKAYVHSADIACTKLSKQLIHTISEISRALLVSQVLKVAAIGYGTAIVLIAIQHCLSRL